MKKIIIRNKTVLGQSSILIQRIPNCDKICDAVNKYGSMQVLSQVFEEEFDDNSLQNEFQHFMQGGDSKLFNWVYPIESMFGIAIDNHITLYRFNKQLWKEEQKIFGWIYPESKRYIGDSWYFDEKEILRDIQKLPLLKFYEKYKGI